MARLCGPILGWRGQVDNIWRVTVMVAHDDTGPSSLSYGAAGGAPAEVALSALGELGGASFLGAQLSVPMDDNGKTIEYGFAGDEARWRFFVPGRTEQPRLAYASCNGFSLPGDMKKIPDKNALWRDVAAEQARQPFHLLLMGGDQIYADQLWDVVPELRRFNELHRDQRIRKQASTTLRRNLDKFLVATYKDRFGPQAIADALASIPSLMMWDDHDIFDGWGSYSDEEQASPVFQTIFEAARAAFIKFQLNGDDTASNWPRLPGQDAFNALFLFGDLAILVLDLRSERTQQRILSPASWEAVFNAVDGLNGDGLSSGPDRVRHLLVMSSIPVIHPDMSFLERGFALLPGQQGLEDDLHDQWVSYNHKTERLRMIHRLLDFAELKGTRVTFLSGDVHVAAVGIVESARRRSRWTNAGALNQITSSAIVHPSPPRVVHYFLEQIGERVQEIDRDISAQMLQFPGTNYRFVGERNWLTIDVDATHRLWINWRIENASQPLTKVIHPCVEAGTIPRAGGDGGDTPAPPA